MSGKTRAVVRSCFPQILFALFQYRISKAAGFRDLLSQSHMHIVTRDEEDYIDDVVASRAKNLTRVGMVRVMAFRHII